MMHSPQHIRLIEGLWDGIQQKLGCEVALVLLLNNCFKTSAARSLHCFLIITQKQHDLYYSSDCSKEIKCK